MKSISHNSANKYLITNYLCFNTVLIDWMYIFYTWNLDPRYLYYTTLKALILWWENTIYCLKSRMPLMCVKVISQHFVWKYSNSKFWSAVEAGNKWKSVKKNQYFCNFSVVDSFRLTGMNMKSCVILMLVKKENWNRSVHTNILLSSVKIACIIPFLPGT